jgi:hypothetical protein
MGGVMMFFDRAMYVHRFLDYCPQLISIRLAMGNVLLPLLAGSFRALLTNDRSSS